jgi:hypothetical protein
MICFVLIYKPNKSIFLFNLPINNSDPEIVRYNILNFKYINVKLKKKLWNFMYLYLRFSRVFNLFSGLTLFPGPLK